MRGAETKSDLIYTAAGLLAASLAFEDDRGVKAIALLQDQEAYEADLADDTVTPSLSQPDFNIY
jgi:hypothetical protein